MKARDRTPSFYTSRSILHLSGLSVSDPTHTPKRSPTSPKDRDRDSSRKSKESNKSDYEREENWIVDDVANGYDDYEEEEDDSSGEEGNGTPLSIQKTTSMANFYYKKSRSSDEILHSIVK